MNAPDDQVPLDAYILDGMSSHRVSEPDKLPTRLIETADDFIARYTPVDYVVDGLIIRGYLYGLTSRPNHGKTTVATAIAVHVANDRPLAGLQVSGGRVLMLYGENAENSRLLLVSALQHYEFESGPIDILSLSLPLADHIDQIIRECDQEYALVVVDSAASYFSYANENDNVDAGRHARDLRRLTEIKGKPAVLICCHPTKGADRDNLTPRGGGAFLAELDTNLTLWATDGSAELGHNKVRGPVPDGLTFSMPTHTLDGYKDRHGRPMAVPVAVPISEGQAAQAHREMVEGDNRLLYAMLHFPDHSIAEWAVDCGWRTSVGKPHKSKVFRSIERFIHDKIATKTRKGYCLTASGKTEAKAIS